MSEQDYNLDKALIRAAFDDAAASYDDVAVLQREVGQRLVGRLDLIRLQPERVLDVGAGTGVATRALMDRFPKSRFIALDSAPKMLRRARKRAPWLRRLPCVGGDAEALPLVTGSCDLVFSNLALHWCGSLDKALTECLRVLRPGGLLLFSAYGPDTLKELRASWAAVDTYVHVNAFVDMHDLGDALVRAQFADPVMDMEYFTLTYPDTAALMHDLKAGGAHNVNAGRRRGLTGKGQLAAMRDAYEQYRTAEGRLPASYEVVYGHAWAPAKRPQRADATGAVRVPISAIERRRPQS